MKNFIITLKNNQLSESIANEWIEIHGFLRSDHQLGNDICKISITNKSLIRLHPFYLGRVKSMSLTTFLTNE
jgi:hypothetical protein